MYVNRGRVSESNKIIPTSGQCKIIHPDESESWLPGLSHIRPTPKNIVLGRAYVKGRGYACTHSVLCPKDTVQSEYWRLDIVTVTQSPASCGLGREAGGRRSTHQIGSWAWWTRWCHRQCSSSSGRAARERWRSCTLSPAFAAPIGFPNIVTLYL